MILKVKNISEIGGVVSSNFKKRKINWKMNEESVSL